MNSDSVRVKLKRSLERGLEGYVFFSLFGLVLLAVIWGVTLHLIALERTNVENNAIESSRELIETYEAQMTRNLVGIDQTLKVIKYAYELRGKKFSLTELTDKGLLPSALVFTISITDQDGVILASNRLEKLASVAGQSYFEIHSIRDVGAPLVSQTSRRLVGGEPIIQFSRRLNAADGTFSGIAIVAVDPSYFTSGYERSRLGEHGVLGLLGSDGVFRAKRSGEKESWGEVVNYELATHGPGPRDGNTKSDGLMVNPWDGVRRYTNAQRLHGFPLTAIVGLSEAEQLEGFHQREHTYQWQATAASALLLAIVAAIGRLSRQLSKTRRRIRRIQETYYAASEASLDAFFVLRSEKNGKGMIHDFVLDDTNNQGQMLIGTSKQALLGKRLCELYPECRNNGIFEQLVEVATTGNIYETEWKNQLPSVRPEWLYRQVVQVEDGVVAIVRDISERKRLETRVQYQATHDALTGLANRNLLYDRLNQAIAYAARYDHSIWVVFLDLDRFKLVNDSLGHKAGDTFLNALSDRLRAAMRETDTVARLGGDEFVLVLPGSPEGSLSLGTLHRIMDIVRQTFLIEEREFSLTCSIGVAVYPIDGTGPETLIERADIAMYCAKEAGRNNFQFFTPTMNERLLERLHIEDDLRKALERNEFVLHYQPQVDLRTGRMIGMEALIRWQHPQRGLVPPFRFISVAEETGLIVPIGAWVIRTACAQNQAWQQAGLGHLRVAVNLSTSQFTQPDLVQSIASILKETGLDAQYLEIELTESLMMTDVEHGIGILCELKALGVHLSVDDFGTGYSSLSYLKRFPIDMLKIDQSFVREITVEPDDAAIVMSIISLAHSLHLEVIAEGVETLAQLTYLRDNGCDEMQGYYFSKPVVATEFEVMLREEKSLPEKLIGVGAQRQTLLIVDAEAGESSMVQECLYQDGYDILVAKSASEAFELLALNQVHVVICDQHLPSMDGATFLSRVKHLHPNTIRTIFAEHAESQSIIDAINHGAVHHFFTKPWKDTVMRESMRDAFRYYARQFNDSHSQHNNIAIPPKDGAMHHSA